jgi:lipid A ethanolaminephosphotransferase
LNSPNATAGTGARAVVAHIARRPIASVEALALCASLFFSVFGHAVFWREVFATGDLHGATGLLSGISLFVLIAALQTFLFCLLLYRPVAKPVLIVLLLVSALAIHFMSHYMIYLDADMIRNVLHTDAGESSEMITVSLLPTLLLYGVLPALVVWRLELKRRPLLHAAGIRLAWLAASAVVAIGSALLSFQDLSALMRTHHDLRHLITPGNYLVALVEVMTEHGVRPKTRIPVGLDARVAMRPADARPRVLLLVVGETVRAQNWGLNGYARLTTPELARIAPINFEDVSACGTSTEVSLPCMFSPYGRADYDKDRIARSESLLHVLDHAGIRTQWRDNQSGCKGVCSGLPYVSFGQGKDSEDCAGESCLDEDMLAGLADEIAVEPGDLVVVMHQLGNHGPSYYKRYPLRLRRFTPTCDSDDLGDCSREQIVNSYDNAVLYTDEFVARMIRMLSAQDSHDAALIYVSDHGESLGEGGLYLHGLPYAIAPATQTRVPMIMWLSPGLTAAQGIDVACLRQRAARPASHDNLFHSVLGLLMVDTQAYVPTLDLFASCSRDRKAGGRDAG